MGEGLWLWRIHNYLQTGDHKAFDQLMGKTVQYLLSRKDKRLFRVVTDGTYSSSEHINIQAELYNPSHEAVLGADINFILTNENNESFSYQFSSSGTTYNLEMGFLRPGVYQYEATTQYGSNTHSAGGEFVVQYTSLEQRNLQANHALLYRLASQKNGEMVYAHNMGSIYSLLKDQSQIKSRVYFEELFSSLHTSVLILLIIVILLSIEWFLRKYLGGY